MNSDQGECCKIEEIEDKLRRLIEHFEFEQQQNIQMVMHHQFILTSSLQFDQIQYLPNIIQFQILMKATLSSVQVIARIKGNPNGDKSSYEIDQTDQNSFLLENKLYKFDHILQGSNEQIFQAVGSSAIESLIEGYNGCIFVFGQTGTGKTYTMTGNNAEYGLVQKCFHYLQHILKSDHQIIDYSIRMSYYEIYNEIVMDLLADKKENMEIRQCQLNFYIELLKQIGVNNQQSFERSLRKGISKRQTKSTSMNETSSRSHSVLTIYLQSGYLIDNQKYIRTSKLNFVDLAGSERQKETKAEGMRLKQGTNINKSLLTLTQVISKLSLNKGKNVMIPYRESALTKLLKDSLGGNSKTVIIGTLSAQKAYVSQSKMTLTFLMNAKKIINKVKINQKMQDKELQLKIELSSQEKKLKQVEQQNECLKTKVKEFQQKMVLYEYENVQLKKKLEEQALRLNERSFHQLFQENVILFDQNNGISFQQNNQHNQSLFTIFEQNNQQEWKQQDINNLHNRYTEQDIRGNPANQLRQKQNNRINSKQSKAQSILSQPDHKILKMENDYLKNQLNHYLSEQYIYQQYLKIIHQNIKNLNFSEAQLVLMKAFEQKAKNSEIILKQCQSRMKLIIQYYGKYRMMSVLETNRIQIQNISKQSKMVQGQFKLKRQIQECLERQYQLQQQLSKQSEKHHKELYIKNMAIFALQQKNNLNELKICELQAQIEQGKQQLNLVLRNCKQKYDSAVLFYQNAIKQTKKGMQDDEEMHKISFIIKESENKIKELEKQLILKDRNHEKKYRNYKIYKRGMYKYIYATKKHEKLYEEAISYHYKKNKMLKEKYSRFRKELQQLRDQKKNRQRDELFNEETYNYLKASLQQKQNQATFLKQQVTKNIDLNKELTYYAETLHKEILKLKAHFLSKIRCFNQRMEKENAKKDKKLEKYQSIFEKIKKLLLKELNIHLQQTFNIQRISNMPKDKDQNDKKLQQQILCRVYEQTSSNLDICKEVLTQYNNIQDLTRQNSSCLQQYLLQYFNKILVNLKKQLQKVGNICKENESQTCFN